jgi:type I restriction enzyme S subunit
MPEIVGWIEGQAIGATMPNLNTDILNRVPVSYPKMETQRKIAGILTTYDDLIEVNRRRIALLEKLAEELYREWFVRLRFPGFQQTQFVKGVPAGWVLRPFSELVTMNPREAVNKDDFVPYAGMEALSADSMFFVATDRRNGAAGSKFRNRDVLLPRITPCLENGKRGFVACLEAGGVAIGSTEFIVFREKVLPAEYIYQLTCMDSFRQHAELSMTGASGRQRVQTDCFTFFLIPTPPNELLQKFAATAAPMFDLVFQLARQNALLTRSRDLLLPRLISGKLAVEELEIAYPPSMAPD